MANVQFTCVLYATILYKRILQPPATFQFYLKLHQSSYDQSTGVVTDIFLSTKYMAPISSLAVTYFSVSRNLTMIFDTSGATTRPTLDVG